LESRLASVHKSEPNPSSRTWSRITLSNLAFEHYSTALFKEILVYRLLSKPSYCASSYSSWYADFFTLDSISYPIPNLFLICYELPMHLKIPPRTIIPIFVDKASASSIEWVVRMTADFLSRYEIFSTTCHMKRLASGSMPADGSSRSTIGGLPMRARPTESFLLFPPLKVPANLCLWSLRFKSLIAFSTTGPILCVLIPLIRA